MQIGFVLRIQFFISQLMGLYKKLSKNQYQSPKNYIRENRSQRFLSEVCTDNSYN